MCGSQQIMMDPLAPPPGSAGGPIYHEPVYNMEPPGAPSPRVVTSQSASRGPQGPLVTSHAKTAVSLTVLSKIIYSFIGSYLELDMVNVL